MTPPPAEQIASRVFLGPALRTQPDKRLVKLVREGYESAFEEIVRRYRRPLDRFAASIVGGRSEDITQDAFSKALLALRGSDAEIELRPWLYRIVRNTALNDLRDRPPEAAQLEEAIPGGLSAAETAERRAEMKDLMGRLRALPEPQRAAIVMRELEGLSHDEIAAALGVSGGAARQAIYRARETLRAGFGALIPLPLLRLLIDHGGEAAAGAGAVGTASAGAAGGGALGAFGAGGAIKAGVATVLVAGSVGAGAVAIHGERDGAKPAAAEASAAGATLSNAATVSRTPGSSPGGALGEDRHGNGGEGSDDGGGRRGHGEGDDDRSTRSGSGRDDSSGGRRHSDGKGDDDRGGRDGGERSSGHRQSDDREPDDDGERHGGRGGGEREQAEDDGPSGGHEGHGDSGSGGSGSGSSSDDDHGESTPPPPPPASPPPAADPGDDSEDSSQSGSDESGSSGSGGGEDDS